MNAEPTGQSEVAVGICPFFGQSSGDSSPHQCRSEGTPISISSRYAGSYCMASQHQSCSRFVAAAPSSRGRDRRPRQVAASSAAGAGVGSEHLVSSLRHHKPEASERPETSRPSLSDRMPRFSLRFGIPSGDDLRRARPLLLLIAILLVGALAIPRLDDLGASRAASIVPPSVREKVSKGVAVIPKTIAKVTSRGPEKAAAEERDRKIRTVKPKAKAAVGTNKKQAQTGSKSVAGKKASGSASARAGKRQGREIVGERSVANGDYLRKISQKYYGDEMLWPLIWDYNKKRAAQSGQKLEDPDLIYPGWVFLIPEEEKAK